MSTAHKGFAGLAQEDNASCRADRSRHTMSVPQWYMSMCIKIFVPYWLTILFLVTGSAVQADIFKWTDASGQIHYGDESPTETTGVEIIDTFECSTQGCLEEQERRWQDTMEANARIQDWLEQRAVQRGRAREPWNPATVYVHTQLPPRWAFIHYPGAVPGTRVSPHRPHPRPSSRRGQVHRVRGASHASSHRYRARPRIGTPGTAVNR